MHFGSIFSIPALISIPERTVIQSWESPAGRSTGGSSLIPQPHPKPPDLAWPDLFLTPTPSPVHSDEAHCPETPRASSPAPGDKDWGQELPGRTLRGRVQQEHWLFRL